MDPADHQKYFGAVRDQDVLPKHDDYPDNGIYDESGTLIGTKGQRCNLA